MARDVDQSQSAAKETAWGIFEAFDGLDIGHICAETDTFNLVPFLRLDTSAHGVFLEWRQDLESRLRDGALAIRN